MNKPERHYIQRAAQTLGQARARAGLSLRVVARRAGTSHTAIYAYEQGDKVPSVETFQRILDACGFAVDFVMLPRIRYRDGLYRGDELEQVLELAEEFPARLSRHMSYPKFSDSV